MARKKAISRRKIPMRTIPSKSPHDAIFSKLKNDLFRETFELCLLTGAQVCAIVFSPDGKPYTFGYPSVDMIANKFLNHSPPSNKNPDQDRYIISVLSQRYNDMLARDVLARVDAVKRKNDDKEKELVEHMDRQLCSLLGAPRHQLSSDQKAQYQMILEESLEKVEKRIQELSVKGSGAIASSSGNSEGLSGLNVANPPEMETSGSP